MKVLIVYDTDSQNCRNLHHLLKKYLHWNQRSCFEGSVTNAQFFEIQKKIETARAAGSHVCLYSWEDERTFRKIELGPPVGNTSNQI